MGWEIALVVCVGGMVFILGAIGAAFYIGKGYQDPYIDSLEARIKTLEATLEEERKRTKERSSGGHHDMAIDRALSDAADADSVLRDAFPEPGADTASSKSSGAPGGVDPESANV